jgi:serine protease inhibitor
MKHLKEYPKHNFMEMHYSTDQVIRSRSNSQLEQRDRSNSQLEVVSIPPVLESKKNPSSLHKDTPSFIEKNKDPLEDFFGKKTTETKKKPPMDDFFHEEEEEEDDFFKEKVEIKKDSNTLDLLSLISKKEETVQQPIIPKKKLKSIPNNNQDPSFMLNSSSEIKTSHFIHSIQYIGNEVMKRIDHSGNILVSPWSLMTLMAMLLNLNSNKKEILSSLFHLKIQQEDGVPKRVNHLIKKELTNLKKNSSYILSNSIWTKNNGMDSLISEDLKNYLMTTCQPFQSVSDVNEWMDENTDGHITSVLDRNTPTLKNSKEKMCISTSYFKGIWKYRFDSKKTVYSNFHLNENESKKIYMMQQKGIFKYVETTMYQGVELDYGIVNKSSLSMVILLPKKNYSTKDLMDFEVGDFKEMSGTLHLPKFRLFFSIDSLSEVFLDLIGSKSILDTNYILIQKSYLDVSEEGLEYNSQTYSKSDFYEEQSGFEMTVDHPFTILVRDISNNMILYQGIVKNPILLN